MYFRISPEQWSKEAAIIVLLAVLFVTAVYISFLCIKKRMLVNSSLSRIDMMSGVEFEEFCIAAFKKKGYSAKPTDTTGDYGADIILKKDHSKIVVQCKRYKGSVGIAAVQEAIGAVGYYKADRAMVVTNSRFTPNAVNLAKANNVELWDRNRLRSEFGV